MKRVLLWLRRFLLWLIGVTLGVGAILAAVMALSYNFTTEGSVPVSAAQFGGVELEPNGHSWQVPLVGGLLDRVFVSPQTLTVQKLGVLYDAHPAITPPDWATYAVIEITDGAGSALFRGSAGEYDAFLYPSNGEYKAELTIWRLPEAMAPGQYAWPRSSVVQNAGLERPARPTGCYQYSFRFQMASSGCGSAEWWARASRWSRPISAASSASGPTRPARPLCWWAAAKRAGAGGAIFPPPTTPRWGPTP